MTTDADFVAAINAAPGDWNLLLVYADFRDEHDLPGGDGFRALAVQQKTPWWFKGTENWGWIGESHRKANRFFCPSGGLPDDWHSAVPVEHSDLEGLRGYLVHTAHYSRLTPFPLIEAAALGFMQLPAERRAELLNPVPVPA